MKVGIVGSPRNHVIRELLTRVADAGERHDFQFFTDPELNGYWPEPVPILEKTSRLDLLITFGGDGTMLRGIRAIGAGSAPVLGINLGTVGFLTTAGPDRLDEAFDAVTAGAYTVEDRDTLVATIVGADGVHRPGEVALNDVVLHHSHVSKVIHLMVSLEGGEEIGQYSADGMVIATSTGSTAYSLSSGGPIMTPEVDALVITPIAAHTLAVRPVVVPGDSVVSVELTGRTRGKITVSYDGDPLSDVARGERLVVKRSQVPVSLIRLPGEGFFSRMRQKLQWGDLIDRKNP